ncbi:hypothetical protein KDW67_33375, partial [Burkholderia cenocepacia]|uniref:hypothetical protein n=1 Tax=Burkholderia cenocepacia TaxID=95486 RepID=UPI001B941E4E
TALRLGQNFDAFHVMTRLTDRHKTIPYFKRVLVSSDTWGRSTSNGRSLRARSGFSFDRNAQVLLVARRAARMAEKISGCSPDAGVLNS